MKDYTTKLRKLIELIEDIDEEYGNDVSIIICDYNTFLADRLLYSGVAPVVQSEWVYSEHDIPHCSECGFEPKCISPYCPNCGANMDEEQEDN